MKYWLIDFIMIAIFMSLLIGIVVILIKLIINKKKAKPLKSLKISLLIVTVLFSFALIFIVSHSTYYKYNDWYVLNSKIDRIEKVYGKFDIGSYEKGIAGTVGYYIYTDNGPVMPDHLKHYYYIEYDKSGNITNVLDGVQPGG